MVDLRGLQQTLGSGFSVERELTGGGMSRVFVARDAVLGRRVVVKVLPEELAASVSVDRFKREIQLAATLQHPHIVGVLSAGEIDGMPYFTMPFVDGESLRARIEREGRLSVSRTVSILKDVARALAFAHERGVIHRDIKPDNVLLAGGSAAVTDFGIAKALLGSVATDPGLDDAAAVAAGPSASHSALTQLGTTLGTPAYMAPEQAAGDATTDHRADIYSFGIMGYEMLTGQVPFRSKTPQALLAAQLTATPAPIPARRDDVPVPLARLVMRCLEKEREKRPQSAREVAEMLESPDMVSGAFASAPQIIVKRGRWRLIAAVTVATVLGAAGAAFVMQRTADRKEAEAAAALAARAADRARSLVVLPFVNIGRDSADAYLAEGITSGLINVLGGVPGLRVTSRSVANSAREKFATAEEIGAALNVGRILEGTVQRDGARVRVTARVTNTDDGFMLWSDMYEREMKDVFAVQDEITAAIADALGAQIGDAAADPASNRGTADDLAYDLYLRGRHFFDLRGEAALRRALDLFRQATQRDPDFARAHAGVAGVLSVLPLYSSVPSDSVFAPGIAAASYAIQLDSSLAEAYVSRAALLMNRWRWREAESDLRRAIALDDGYAAAHQAYGEMLLVQNRLPESLQQLQIAADLDPLSAVIASSRAMALALARRDAEAVAEANRGVGLDSTLFLPRMVLGLAHVLANRTTQGIQVLETAVALSGDTPYARAVLASAYARNGQPERSRSLMKELTPNDADSRAALGMVQVAVGDTAAALENLEQAVAAHAPFFTAQPLWAPVFDPVKSSARFQALLRSIRL